MFLSKIFYVLLAMQSQTITKKDWKMRVLIFQCVQFTKIPANESPVYRDFVPLWVHFIQTNESWF